jgi:hypothetical protein
MLRVSYARSESRRYWHGVIRDEAGREVWRCEHAHRNREHGNRLYLSATECARRELATRPH